MITGGGTGGHTSPATAIIEELQRRDPRLTLQWVGKRGNIEERLCKRLSIPFRPVAISGWPRTPGPRKLWVGAQLAWSIARSWFYIKRFEPGAVLGVGSYVSLPLMLAAQRMGVPTIIHEQNKRLGMANALLAPKAARVFLSYPETQGVYPEERAMVTGNPVRGRFLSPPTRAEACKALGLDPVLPVVLITGGSQGARTLNHTVRDALPQFGKNELQVLWMTGSAFVPEARAAAAQAPIRVDVFRYIDDMATACAAADLIVSRAGASSTAEIAALGKPSILVPYPFATDDHQTDNARALEGAGGAVAVPDGEFTPARFLLLTHELLGDPARLQAMGKAAHGMAKPGAAEAIAEAILETVFSGEADAAGAQAP